jgi:hypothetical protein
MNRAASHITGASASRLAVAARFAFAYQDSGYERHLMDGNLDAPCSMPAGGQRGRELQARRNVAEQLLTVRTGSAA